MAALAGPPVTLRGPAPDVALDFIHNAAVASGCGSTATSCITDTRASTKWCDYLNGNWVSVTANVPCITDRGFLIEDPATNYIRNNSMQGAVIAAPGTLPTNWVDNMSGPLNGISRSIVGLGTENGIDYIDYRLSGTASTGTTINLNLETNNSTAAARNQKWTESFFLYLKAGSTNNGGLTVKLAIYGLNSAFTTTETAFSPVTITGFAPLGLSRSSLGMSLTNAATVWVKPVVAFTIVSGNVIDATFRIGWPQMERQQITGEPGLGYSAEMTSPIRTVNAAVVRAGDIVSLTNPPVFGSKFTMYAAAVPTVDDTPVWLMSAGVPSNSGKAFGMYLSAGGGASLKIAGCATNWDYSFTNNVWARWQPVKLACSAAPDGVSGNRIVSLNGSLDSVTYPPDNDPTVPALQTVSIGSSSPTYTGGDAYITAIGIWPTVQLTADALKAITTVAPTPIPDIWLDFAGNAAVAPAVPGCGPMVTSCLTTTRASPKACDNKDGSWLTVGNNVACVTDKGILVEGSAINYVRNNTMVGAAAGGALPTNWSFGNVSGLSSQVVGTGVDGGIDYVDIRLFGTTSGAGAVTLVLEPQSSGSFTSQWDGWCASVFVRLVGGTAANVTGVASTVVELNSTGGFLASASSPLVAPTSAFQRLTQAITFLDPAAGSSGSRLDMGIAGSGLPVDITLRIGWPQLEFGQGPSSPIRTLGSASVTREADAVWVTTPTTVFGRAVSMYAAYTPLTLGAFTVTAVVNVSDGTTNNRAHLSRDNNGRLQVMYYAQNVGAGISGSEDIPTGIPAKMAGAFQSGDQAGVVNGGAPLSLAVFGAFPPLSRIAIGGWPNGSFGYVNGYITQVGVWTKTRLSNDQLVGLTR
jgi:hypothetical protein